MDPGHSDYSKMSSGREILSVPCESSFALSTLFYEDFCVLEGRFWALLLVTSANTFGPRLSRSMRRNSLSLTTPSPLPPFSTESTSAIIFAISVAYD